MYAIWVRRIRSRVNTVAFVVSSLETINVPPGTLVVAGSGGCISQFLHRVKNERRRISSPYLSPCNDICNDKR